MSSPGAARGVPTRGGVRREVRRAEGRAGRRPPAITRVCPPRRSQSAGPEGAAFSCQLTLRPRPLSARSPWGTFSLLPCNSTTHAFCSQAAL